MRYLPKTDENEEPIVKPKSCNETVPKPSIVKTATNEFIVINWAVLELYYSRLISRQEFDKGRENGEYSIRDLDKDLNKMNKEFDSLLSLSESTLKKYPLLLGSTFELRCIISSLEEMNFKLVTQNIRKSLVTEAKSGGDTISDIMKPIVLMHLIAFKGKVKEDEEGMVTTHSPSGIPLIYNELSSLNVIRETSMVINEVNKILEEGLFPYNSDLNIPEVFWGNSERARKDSIRLAVDSLLTFYKKI